KMGSVFRGAWNKEPRDQYKSLFSRFLSESTSVSVSRDTPKPLGNPVRVQHECVFQRRAEGHRRHVGAGDPRHGRIQAGEAPFSKLSSNLGAEATRPVRLVD